MLTNLKKTNSSSQIYQIWPLGVSVPTMTNESIVSESHYLEANLNASHTIKMREGLTGHSLWKMLAV